ncbi:hypothetical protein MMC21_002604 [Puttea exsequens]|nr:hypothetical protein [Puttea exsequens]
MSQRTASLEDHHSKNLRLQRTLKALIITKERRHVTTKIKRMSKDNEFDEISENGENPRLDLLCQTPNKRPSSEQPLENQLSERQSSDKLPLVGKTKETKSPSKKMLDEWFDHKVSERTDMHSMPCKDIQRNGNNKSKKIPEWVWEYYARRRNGHIEEMPYEELGRDSEARKMHIKMYMSLAEPENFYPIAWNEGRSGRGVVQGPESQVYWFDDVGPRDETIDTLPGPFSDTMGEEQIWEKSRSEASQEFERLRKKQRTISQHAVRRAARKISSWVVVRVLAATL